jgi:GlpG protein
VKPVAALRLPLATDLSGFVALLQRLEVPCRVSEESGQQVLWVPGEELAERVRQLHAQFPEGDPQAGRDRPSLAMSRRPGGLLQQLRFSPVTAGVLALTLIVALLTKLGDNLEIVGWLTFQEVHRMGDYLFFVPLEDSLRAGQWWRLVSPMLLHFGVLHIAFNSLWYWELGRRIESRQGGLVLALLTLLFSLVSNCAQYRFTGPSLFGGLSGVLYGLLGHCWLFQRLAPTPAYRLPPGVLVMMLAWLLICMTGIFELLQFGAIANAAHVGGLLTGCLTGLLGGMLARRSA